MKMVITAITPIGTFVAKECDYTEQEIVDIVRALKSGESLTSFQIPQNNSVLVLTEGVARNSVFRIERTDGESLV